MRRFSCFCWLGRFDEKRDFSGKTYVQLTKSKRGIILCRVCVAVGKKEYGPMAQDTVNRPNRLRSITERRQQLHELVDCIANYCESNDGSFFAFEKKLRKHVWALARLLLGLFLLARHLRLQKQDRDYPGYRRMPQLCRRTLRTMYGKVRYKRTYCAKRQGGGGFHPLDAELGLTRDGFSPWVISLACRLSAYLSYAKTTLVMEAFWGWSPSTETVEQWALGVAREGSAYMASSPPFPEIDGEVLVIEVDGKAVPTVREDELAKRRGPRQHGKHCACGCQRHRGQAKRRHGKSAGKSRKKRRKKGDKSKNGRSATLVAMYTLSRGKDGKLHGPINKRVWGSFASRKTMLHWARAEATRRGFGPKTRRLVQIVVDGEICLAKRLRKLFRKAIVTLDIRHVEEKLWQAGCAFHPEGSSELAAWVEELRTLLYHRSGKAMVARLEELRRQIACRGPGTKRKRDVLDKLIGYLMPRTKMMRYAKWIKQDLVIASGVIEGAVRYVIGERMDCSGMRWIEEKAEAILHLRCIEVNGLWDHYFEWCQDRWQQKLCNKETVQIRTDKPLELADAA
jgi:hypothetical protein